jgi:putative ABC transport system permease protein
VVSGFWRIAARLAWRDLRSSPARAAFLAATIAIGVASVGGVRGADAAAREVLSRDVRMWLGGDLCVDTGEAVDEGRVAALDGWRAEGIDWTLVTWLLSMASSSQSPDAGYLAIMAIDPGKYPFYGAPTMAPRIPLRQALTPDSAVISEAAVRRFHVGAGDSIRIGGQWFRIAAVIRAEPERFGSVFGWGPRAIVSEAGLERLAAASAANAPLHRILLRLPRGADLGAARKRLRELAPEGAVADYRDAASPAIAKAEMVLSFCAVAAFLALAMGVMGVAVTVRQALDQRMETLAVMRMLGARGWQMAAFFGFETAWLAAAGLAAGIPLGWWMRHSLLWLGGKYVPFLDAARGGDWALAEIAIAAGAMIFPMVLQPAAAIHKLRPLRVLRRDTETGGATLAGVRQTFLPAALVAGAAWLAVAVRMLHSVATAALLLGALTAASFAAAGLAAGGLSCLRWWAGLSGRRMVKMGVERLEGGRRRSATTIVSLAIGLMLIAGTYETAGAVARAATASLPYGDANLLVGNFQDEHRELVRSYLSAQPGAEAVRMMSMAALRLADVDGKPGTERLYLVECDQSAGTGRLPMRVTVADDLAARLGLRVGSRLIFQARERTIPAVVAAIHRSLAEERFWYTFRVESAGLDLPNRYDEAVVTVRPDRLEAVRDALGARFPTLAAITAGELRATIGDVYADGMMLIRLVAGYAIAGGLSVLIAMVAASRAGRLREMGILAALGARPRTIAGIYTVEFAAIGLVAGAIGGLLACGFGVVLTSALFRRLEIALEWRGIAGAVLAAPLITIATGWLPAWRLLRRKPMEALRRE